MVAMVSNSQEKSVNFNESRKIWKTESGKSRKIWKYQSAKTKGRWKIKNLFKMMKIQFY